jgi:hypothetical protein
MEILVYGSPDGLKLDYVYECAGETLTIWFGHKGSDNFMKGTCSPDGKSFSYEWKWPGGGYKVTGTRLA